MAADTMDIDMDVELDLDGDMDPELARLRAEAAKMNALPSLPDAEVADAHAEAEEMNGVEEGEVGLDEMIGNKVNLSGLDQLTTSDIENFASDHFSTAVVKRVEWIDDHSANLVFASEHVATEALRAYSAVPADDPLESRRALELATHPHVQLYVRMARATDVKEAGAAQRSRFYLMNPEFDPESRLKRRRFDPSRRGSGYRRGRDDHQDRRSSRKRSQDGDPFDVNLYDDDSTVVRATKANHPPDDDPMRRWNHEKPARRGDGELNDLFAGRHNGRLRNRSASPLRGGDVDGRFGFGDDDQPYRQTARRRSPPPIRPRSIRDNYSARDSIRTELFPTKKIGTALTNGHVDGTNAPVELFPAHSVQPRTKELFPDKAQHRRQDAQDIHPDEVADAIGKCDLQQQLQLQHDDDDAFTYGHFYPGRRPEITRERNADLIKPRPSPRDLFSRIDGGPGLAIKAAASSGRLSERPHSEGSGSVGGGGFSIKGAGEAAAQGFSIRGASREAFSGVTELFPQRNGGFSGSGTLAREDLFAHKMKGRGAQRRQAEDLY